MSGKNKKPGGSDTQSINLDTKEVTVAKKRQPGAFEKLAACFALKGITLRRSNWRRGTVRYFALRDGEGPELCSLSDLALMVWVIGGLNA